MLVDVGLLLLTLLAAGDLIFSLSLTSFTSPLLLSPSKIMLESPVVRVFSLGSPEFAFDYRKNTSNQRPATLACRSVMSSTPPLFRLYGGR